MKFADIIFQKEPVEKGEHFLSTDWKKEKEK